MSEQLQHVDYAVQVPRQEIIEQMTRQPEILKIAGNVINAAPGLAQAWQEVQDYAEKQRILCEETYPEELRRLAGLRSRPQQRLYEVLTEIQGHESVADTLFDERAVLEMDIRNKQLEKQQKETEERDLDAKVRAYESHHDSWRDHRGTVHRITNEDRMGYLLYESYGSRTVSPRDVDQTRIQELITERDMLDTQILSLTEAKALKGYEISTKQNVLHELNERKLRIQTELSEIDTQIQEVLDAFQLLHEQLGRSKDATASFEEPEEDVKEIPQSYVQQEEWDLERTITVEERRRIKPGPSPEAVIPVPEVAVDSLAIRLSGRQIKVGSVPIGN